jgi:hypothetical protein
VLARGLLQAHVPGPEWRRSNFIIPLPASLG